MRDTQTIDTVSFPGGHDWLDEVAAVKLAATRHVLDVPFSETERAVVERFLTGLSARHPDRPPLTDPYLLRAQELLDQRRSLMDSHLRFSWFSLAYWAFGLLAVRSGLSTADHDGLETFVVPISSAFYELGVRIATAQECVEEIDRFLPATVTPRGVETATYAFLSFARFLHFAALRRRQVVTPTLELPSIGIVFSDANAEEAQNIRRFVGSHGVSVIRQPEEATSGTRVLVLLSPEALTSASFWRDTQAWKARPIVPMVVCLMSKALLYDDAPLSADEEAWTWLGDSVALELGSGTDRYVTLLRALDASARRQWWWNKGHTIELGLAVDVAGEGLPRPRPRPRPPERSTGLPYPFATGPTLATPCLLASERLERGEAPDRDEQYFAACLALLEQRLAPSGVPYALPWLIVIYRSWLAFAGHLPRFSYSDEDAVHAEAELRAALRALGIGTAPESLSAFLDAFLQLPWPEPATSISAVDERAVTFVALIDRLSQAAVTRGQRVLLQHPVSPCFISYARPDEDFARALVAYLEAKGADVWWDLHALTLGMPLDRSLSAGIADANVLFVIATPAADRSPYVRFEVEAATQRGLQIVAVGSEGQSRALEVTRTGTPFDPHFLVGKSGPEATFEAALDHLRRTPDAQLRWLQSTTAYAGLLAHLRKLRNRRH